MRHYSIFKFSVYLILTILTGCRTEEITKSESKITSYENKSFWPEDEKYIKNVKAIYEKKSQYINPIDGLPFWNYATTMGNFDESFLLVPIVKNNSVKGIMQVIRKGSKIYFSFGRNNESITFFQDYIFAKNKKPLYSNSKTSSIDCRTVTISVWVPNKESSPEPSSGDGHWDTRTETSCYHSEDECIGFYDQYGGCTNVGGDGYDYPDWSWGGGGSVNSNQNQNIIDNLNGYPCVQQLLRQIPDANSDIAKTINDLFGKNENLNLIFKPKTGMGDVDGETSISMSKEFGTFKATIFLNEDILKYGTKEYILVTMYHEALHAYLDYEYHTLGDKAFNDTYPYSIIGFNYLPDGTKLNTYTFLDQHNYFGAYLNDLKDAVKNFNPLLPNETVSAMTKAGVTTLTPLESNLNKAERDTRNNLSVGTKCQ